MKLSTTMNASIQMNSPDTSKELPEREQYRLLKDERRQLTVSILRDRSLPLNLEDLAVDVASEEFGSQPPTQRVEQVTISLHHVHLPLMDDMGVVRYDENRSEILAASL